MGMCEVGWPGMDPYTKQGNIWSGNECLISLFKVIKLSNALLTYILMQWLKNLFAIIPMQQSWDGQVIGRLLILM